MSSFMQITARYHRELGKHYDEQAEKLETTNAPLAESFRQLADGYHAKADNILKSLQGVPA